MEDFFLEAVKHQQDEVATSYLSILIKCIEDCEYLSFVDQKIELFGEDLKTLERKAGELCARKIMALYPKITKTKEVDKEGYAIIELVLIETKKKAFGLVSEQWKETKNDVLANEYLLFLVKALKETENYKERKQLEDIFRETVDRWFPATRLLKSYNILVDSVPAFRDNIHAVDHQIEKIARTLLVAWGRNSEFAVCAAIFSACEKLVEAFGDGQFSTAGATFELLKAKAGEIAKQHEAVNNLLEKLEAHPVCFWLHSSQASLAYPDSNQVELLIQEKTDWFNREHQKKESEIWLDDVGVVVDNWRKAFPKYRVKIEVLIVQNLNNKTLFELKRVFE